jgi:hypothetical protein
MITSPSQNDLATGLVRPHNADVPVKVGNVSTAPTTTTSREEKDLQNSTFSHSRRQAMFTIAGDNAAYAGNISE